MPPNRLPPLAMARNSVSHGEAILVEELFVALSLIRRRLFGSHRAQQLRIGQGKQLANGDQAAFAFGKRQRQKNNAGQERLGAVVPMPRPRVAVIDDQGLRD